MGDEEWGAGQCFVRKVKCEIKGQPGNGSTSWGSDDGVFRVELWEIATSGHRGPAGFKAVECYRRIKGKKHSS